MIPIPLGWVRTWQTDHFFFKSPNRPVGTLRYREPWGPLTTMRRYLDERIPRLPVGAPEIEKTHPIERITTEEGEHAAIARVDLRCALDRNFAVKRPAVAMFGVVFGDNFMTSLDGLGFSPDHFDELHNTVRDLTRRTVLMLGNPRGRRYVYQSPEGWQTIHNFWGTRFIPPEYPNVGAMITVHPAVPKTRASAFIYSVAEERIKLGAAINDTAPFETMHVPNLSGGRWQSVSRHEGKKRVHVVVELTDGRYTYKLRLDHTADARSAAVRPIFDALCMSIELVPVGRAPVSTETSAAVFDQWSE